ncbi:MAG: hypothetical protein IT178_17170 [Acidobacteria bacterium]|nr:hypothetical protein [Acidobacteriota bacterium]
MWLPRLGVVCGYVLLALAFAWPLPLHLSTHLTGNPGGDTGVYVWNQWVFQHEMQATGNPFSTGRILSLASPVDLTQHNYTAALNLLAYPLIPIVGVVAAFNLVLLIVNVLTALATYALARLAFPATRLEAFIAGVAFAWSPILVARAGAHMSLVAAAPLAAFVYCLIRADQTGQLRHAAAAGVCMAIAALCDAYFAIFCLITGLLYVASRAFSFGRRRSPAAMRWTLDAALLIVGGLILGLAFGRGGSFHVLGMSVSVRGLYTPMLVFTMLALARAAIAVRARLSDASYFLWAVRVAVVGALAGAGPLSPVLYGLGERIGEGRLVSPPVLWRSSPRGADLLAFFQPNPNHPLMRWIGDGSWALHARDVEFVVALSLVSIAIVAFAWWKADYRPPQEWWFISAGFALLALGPFLIVGGWATHAPGPWALLRYVPVIGIARTPTRFAIMTALGLAILLAGALAALGTRWPARRRAIGVVTLVLLLCEALPAPRLLYSAAMSPLLDIIAADPRPIRVLNLPFGVRDGASSTGNFSARSQFEQTRHGKALIGGYLSRVSAQRIRDMQTTYPVTANLIRLSEGESLNEADRQTLMTRAPDFATRASLGYVLIDTSLTTEELRSLAIEAFDLRPVATDGALQLFVPGASVTSP